MLATPGLAALDDSIAGQVILPYSPEYETVRKPFFAQYADVRPALVVRCETPDDVAEAIAFARRSDLRVAVRSGGHCLAGRSATRGLLVDVAPLSAVTLDDEIATVGAGATLGEISERLELHGRTIAAGACPSVGIAGLTVGGGLGILGRRYGLTADQLVAAQVVVADGSVVVCDAQHHEDLFWALRGAGAGQFGVVTGLVFRTVPAQDLTCFHLAWPVASAAALLEAWQSWAPAAPDELAASLLLNTSGDIDRPPTATVFGSMLGFEAEAARLLDELTVRAGAEPAVARLEHLPSGAAKRFLFEHAPGAEPTDGTPAAGPLQPPLVFSKSEFFQRPLPREAIAVLLEHLGAERAPGQARELDFTPWGGAYNRVPSDATAFVHRSDRFLLKHAAVLDADASADERAAAQRWLARSWELVHPWGSGGVYPNFADPELDDLSAAYHGRNADRLARIKATHDPDNVFRSR